MVGHALTEEVADLNSVIMDHLVEDDHFVWGKH